MAYRELLKDFARIRGYMREFYVFGFRRRGDFRAQSGRSYDDERRRAESWLGEYMAFSQDAAGRRVFLSVDSRAIPHNPLYQAFRAKSFTDNDITLHFALLDLLAGGEARSAAWLAARTAEEYYAGTAAARLPDESTVRKKLREYEALGLLESEKRGREVLYRRVPDTVPLARWREAAAFYAEADPLGVVGAYILDRFAAPPEIFRFKHHYILHALDSEVLAALLAAIDGGCRAELTVHTRRRVRMQHSTVLPRRIFCSVQTGRQYLLAWLPDEGRPCFFRLDSIAAAVPGAAMPCPPAAAAAEEKLRRGLWGVSLGGWGELQHVELTVCIGRGEEFVAQRMEREKRCGSVDRPAPGLCRFSADVLDAEELLPWLRTFTGRIVSLHCSNAAAEKRFWADMEEMYRQYGEAGHAVQ